MGLYNLLLLLLFAYIISGDECIKTPDNIQESLKKKLLCLNDPNIRPVKDVSKPIVLQIELKPKYLTKYYMAQMMFISVDMNLTWQNEFLSWKPSDFNDLKEINLPGRSVWTPRISLLFNRINSMALNLQKYPVRFTNTGLAQIIAHERFGVHCTNNFILWPYEIQNCQIYISSDINVNNLFITTSKNNSVDLSLYTDSKVYKLSNIHQATEIWGNKLQKTMVVHYNFTLERHSSTHSAVTIIPIGVGVLLILLSFWINPLDNFRFILLAISMIVHIIIMQSMATIAFSGEENVNIISYIRNSLILCFTAMILLRLSQTMILINGAPEWLTKFKNKINNNQLSVYVVLPKDSSVLVPDNITSLTSQDSKITQEWILAVILFDRLCFIVYLMVYLITLYGYF